MSIGFIWDAGLVAEGVPPEKWADHAAGAVEPDSLLMATFTTEQWEAPEAAGVATACAAVGNLIAVVAQTGTDFFSALTPDDQSELERAAEKINDVLGNLRYWGSCERERPHSRTNTDEASAD